MKNNDRVLFLDASSVDVNVGILSNNNWLGYFKSSEPALQSLFHGIQICLQMANLHFNDLNAFAYCEGPGSLLGIRLTAMAIRAWKEQKSFNEVGIYSYNSFQASLELIKKVHAPLGLYAVVSQSRKGYWNFLSNEPQIQEVSEVEESELTSFPGTLWRFKQKKLMEDEKNLRTMPFDYNFENSPEIFIQEKFLRPVQEPDALFVNQPEYVKWDSKRHGTEDKT